MDDMSDESCNEGHPARAWQLDWSSVVRVPVCRMFSDGIGDRGLPAKFMLRQWNRWRRETGRLKAQSGPGHGR